MEAQILTPMAVTPSSLCRSQTFLTPRLASSFSLSSPLHARMLYARGVTQEVQPLRPCAQLSQSSDADFREPPTVDSILDAIKWDDKGLIVAIAQHAITGSILMQGFANRDAVSATIASGRATFYSRSRSSLWTKGETSSNFINVFDLFLDCDRDSIIYLGEPDGPTCHTGAETCYFTPACGTGNGTQTTSKKYASTTLYSLEETIGKRKEGLSLPSISTLSKPSWTHKLLKDHNLLCSKIREEADELCRTLENDEGKSRTASEMADVLYHSLVLLAVQDVKLEDVLKILQARFALSGIEEKNTRK